MKYRFFFASLFVITLTILGMLYIGNSYVNTPSVTYEVDQRPIILKSVKKLRLETASTTIIQPYHDPKTCEELSWLKRKWSGICIWRKASGQVVGVFDLSKVTISDIRKEGEVYIIKTPVPIFETRIHPNDFENVRLPSFGIWLSLDEEELARKQADTKLEDDMHAAACKTGIARITKESMQELFPKFIALTSGGQAKVRFEVPDVHC